MGPGRLHAESWSTRPSTAPKVARALPSGCSPREPVAARQSSASMPRSLSSLVRVPTYLRHQRSSFALLIGGSPPYNNKRSGRARGEFGPVVVGGMNSKLTTQLPPDLSHPSTERRRLRSSDGIERSRNRKQQGGVLARPWHERGIRTTRTRATWSPGTHHEWNRSWACRID